MKAEGTPHLLLIRFSALGDILMTVPVIKALACQYPDTRITMVSRPFVGSIFGLLPSNVSFVGINPRNYKGIGGLWRMYRELKRLGPTNVIDLHDVLRTKVLRKFFRLSGLPVRHIIKDRKARKNFLTSTVKTQQTTSFERYADALSRAGFPVTIDSKETLGLLPLPECDGLHKIGIAPFAAHQGKIYPLDKMEEVVRLLCNAGVRVYLFGAGNKEKEIMEGWAKKYQGAESVVGTLPDMAAELRLINTLDAMLTMDSGNMHLAALSNTQVASIWGATHPLGGFLGWGCKQENVIEDPSLSCRPCSIYGNKPCKWGDYRCLNNISPETIVCKLLKLCE